MGQGQVRAISAAVIGLEGTVNLVRVMRIPKGTAVTFGAF